MFPHFSQVWCINWGNKLIFLIIKMEIILKIIYKNLNYITTAELKHFYNSFCIWQEFQTKLLYSSTNKIRLLQFPHTLGLTYLLTLKSVPQWVTMYSDIVASCPFVSVFPCNMHLVLYWWSSTLILFSSFTFLSLLFAVYKSIMWYFLASTYTFFPIFGICQQAKY